MKSTALALATLETTASPALAAPGDLDVSFSVDGFDTQNVFNDDCGRDAAVQPDGKVVVVGSCAGGVPTTFSVMRYLPDGSPDQDFGTDGTVNVSFDPQSGTADERAAAVAVQPDGKIVVAGTSTLNESGTSEGGDNFAVARLLPGGALDPSFNPNGAGANQDGRLVVNHFDIDLGADVALGADGSIFVGGTVNVINDGDDFGVMKVTPEGVLDMGYDNDGKVRIELGQVEELHAIAVQADGKVVAAGFTGMPQFPNGTVPLSNRTVGIARFDTQGQPDSSFDDDGRQTLDLGPGGEDANGLALDSSGRIVLGGLAGSGVDLGVARLLAGNGATDLAFDGDGRATVDTGSQEIGYDVAVLPDGKVAVGGTTDSGANPGNLIVALLREDGAPDAGFGNTPASPGVAIHDFGGVDHIDGLAALSDGRLIAVGTAPGVNRDFLTARLQGSPPSPPGGTPQPPAPDVTRPVVNSLTVTRVFAAANRGAAILAGGRRVPVGGIVRYGLSEAAATSFTVERATTGRRVGRRCVKTTRRNRSLRKCTRYVRVRGSFVHRGAVGSNRFRFSGRLRGRKLALGRYRLVAVATDAAGNRSAPKRRAFRIVRRR